MRHSFFVLIVLLATVSINSCKNNIDLKKSLVGHWELRKTASGSNKTSKLFPPGKGINVFFTSTNYKEYSDGSIISMGRYKIIDDTAKSSGTISSKIIFKPEVYSWDTTKFSIVIEKNQLIIGVDSVGALIRFYERLK